MPHTQCRSIYPSMSPANVVPCPQLQCLSSWRVCVAGNAWTDPNIDNEGAVDFWFHHAIISADTKHAFKEACNFSHVGPLLAAAADPDQLSVDPQVGHNAHKVYNLGLGFRAKPKGWQNLERASGHTERLECFPSTLQQTCALTSSTFCCAWAVINSVFLPSRA